MNTTTERAPLVRVSNEHPCTICKKGTWCFHGSGRYHICMRIVSTKTYSFNGGEVGYFHPIGTAGPRAVRQERPTPTLNVARTLESWRGNGRAQKPTQLSIELGVTLNSLELLECVKAPYHRAWGFPMRSGNNTLCGIRIRSEDGDKWAERGSQAGVFIPQCPPYGVPLIVEGPTDCAAALTLGYYAIGRPSCSGGVQHLQEWFKHNPVRRAVIVADLDDPGLRGAKTLAEHLPIPTAIICCPAKDMRQFVIHGGTKETMDAMIGQCVWRQP